MKQLVAIVGASWQSCSFPSSFFVKIHEAFIGERPSAEERHGDSGKPCRGATRPRKGKKFYEPLKGPLSYSQTNAYELKET